MATWKPHDVFAKLNEMARLYCEAFVGTVELPDVHSSISWYQVFDDREELAMDDVYQEIITRSVILN